MHRVRIDRIMVDQEYLELAPVTGIDQSRGIQTGHPVAERQATAGQHETRKPGRDGQSHAGSDESSTTLGGQRRVMSSQQVGSGVARPGVGRYRQVWIEPVQWH